LARERTASTVPSRCDGVSEEDIEASAALRVEIEMSSDGRVAVAGSGIWPEEPRRRDK
jgi:hypothetical protein